MQISPQASAVRQIVLRTFEELTGQAMEPYSLVEMVLIRDGRYRGRTYRGQRLMAMWLVDVGLVQVYRDDGEMLRTINLLEEQVPTRRAA